MGLTRERIGSHFVADVRMQFVRTDGDGLVRFAQRYRHIVQQLHFLAADIDELVILRMQRPDFVEAVDGEFVQRDDVITLRIFGLAFHAAQVADVVVDVLAVFDFTGQVVPFDDLRIDIQ